MKEQLYRFTNKWYGYIPNETDLCSYTLKSLFAMLKFGGLVALVLQPVAFGPLAILNPEVIGADKTFAGAYYLCCVVVLCCYLILSIIYLVEILQVRYFPNSMTILKKRKTLKEQQ